MTIAAIGNIVAITAYFFLTLLFFWVGNIPRANRSTLWWGGATLCTLMARLTLLVMPAHLSAHYVEAVYATFITLEKYFLIIGFMRFFSLQDLGRFSRIVPAVILLEICLIVVLKTIVVDANFFAIQFSLFNAASLLFVAFMILRNKVDYVLRWRPLLILAIVVFSVHWATYPVARYFEIWMQVGFIFGSLMNLLLYLSFAMIALSGFQDRLIHAEREAKKNARRATQSNEAKSQFLANMSHEIRTPMNGVLGMLDVLKKSELDEQQMRQVNIALSSSRSLLTLINDILDFSKIEAGKLTIEKREFNVIDTLDDVGVFLQQLAENKKIELIVNPLGIKHPVVMGDAGRLRQIIVNLAGNAIKFTETGSVELRAFTEYQDGIGVTFRCDIIDTGIGITQEQQSKLFSAFTQADASTTRKYGGTGLGLTICARLCEIMRGDISVTSRLGAGSCFTFSLCFDGVGVEGLVCPYPLLDLSDQNVLVVDDNDTNLMLMKDVFALWKSEPVLVGDAKEAIAKVEASTRVFDLAVVDIQMPDMDGEQLVYHLQSLQKCTDTRFIMFSSSSDERLKARMLASGVDDFLSKPLVIKDLEGAIRSALKARGRTEEGDESSCGIVTEEQAAERNASSPEALLEDTLEKLGGGALPRILLVEDNDVNQFIAESLLEDQGLSCDIADNGQIALDTLNASPEGAPYDFILMDCQMPVMDGYECTRNIRSGAAGDRYKETPIIAMTANAMQGDREKCIAAGMSDYLSKPIEVEAFIKMLIKWIAA